MKKYFIVLLLSLISSQSSIAWTHGTPGATGRAQLNVGGVDFIPANFINVLKTAYQLVTTPTDINKLDEDGYFISAPATNAALIFPPAGSMWTNTQYKLSWPATLQAPVFLNFSATSCIATNATISGGGGCQTITPIPGQAGSVVFTTSTTQFNLIFQPSLTYSRTGGELALYRLSDEAAYLAGEIFTPEYISLLKSANPGAIRTMGWVQVGNANYNSETQWRYRTKATNISWASGGRWSPGAYAGAISGTDTYTVGNTPDTNPLSYEEGEMIIGIISNANTISTPSLNRNGLGAKTIVTNFVGTISAGAIGANTIAIFIYDSVLDRFIYSSNSIVGSYPFEAHIQLANRVRSNLWITVPPMVNDDYISNLAILIRNNLSVALFSYWEYSNEVWNFSFPQNAWARQRGLAFGFSAGSNRDQYGYYGIRVRQIMGNIIPVVFAGRMNKIRRVMAYQGAGDTTNITYRFNGTDLAPSGVGTGQGNAAYNTFTGSANWTTFPNRPVDVTEVMSPAGYATGQNLCDCVPNASNTPFLQALVTAWESGDSATSIQMIDDDIRTNRLLVQNVTASGTTFTTPSPHGFVTSGAGTRLSFNVTGGTTYSGVTINNIYRVTSVPTSTTFVMQAYVGGQPSGASVNAGSAGTGTMTVGSVNNANFININNTYYAFGQANSILYDAIRSGAGMPALRLELYEGAIDINGPTAGQCTTLGIVGSNCSASILAASEAWRFDLKAKATFLTYYDQFMGLDSSMPSTYGLMLNAKAHSQLIMTGNLNAASNFWTLISGPLPTVSPPYQLYYGFAQYNH